MKGRIFKRPFVIVLILLFTVVSLFFASLPFLVRPAFLERLIREKVKKESGYAPSFKRFQFSLFPVPVIHFYSFSLASSKEGATVPFIEAERASFRPSIVSLFFGKVELAQVSLRNATVRFPFRYELVSIEKVVSLENISADFQNVRSGKPIRFKVRGKFLNSTENLVLSGTLRTDFSKFRSQDFASDVQISVSSVELPKLAEWWGLLPFHMNKGDLTFSGKIVKSQGSSELNAEGALRVRNFVYERLRKPTPSLPADYETRFKLQFDFQKGVLILKEGTLTSPFSGLFQIHGKFNISQSSIEELYVKSEALHLDLLPRYVLPFEQILPVNLGFSGESRLEFFAKGDPKLLTLNMQVDLGQTTLTYSKYFSKSPETPFILRGDANLVGGNILRGNFSIEFEQAVFKGSIVDLDLTSGKGEVTVLTNKFDVQGWERYFPPFRQFTLSGGVKFLTSVKGNLNRMPEAQVMTHITFDQLQAKAPNGAEIRKLNGSIDLGPLDSEIKNMNFEVGNSYFVVEGKMFLKPDVRWLLQIGAPQLDLREFVQKLRGFGESLQLEGLKIDWNSIEQSVAFARSGEFFESVETQVAFGGKQVAIPYLRLRAYDGTVSAQAAFDFTKSVPSALIQFDANRLSLARIADPAKQPVLEGNLFVAGTLTEEGPFDGEWLDRLKGNGSISITNGEFHTLDLLGGLGQIAELALLGRFRSGTTKFDDVRGTFEIAQRKMETKDLFLVSDDFQIEAAGDVDFSGNLNYRLSVYLMPKLAQKFSSHLGENERLGPIPLLLVGTVEHPSIQKDPVLVQTFLDYFVREQFSKIASRLLPARSDGSATSPSQNGESANKNAEQPKNLKQALAASGFSLLEQLLSEKKPQKTAS